MNILLCTKYDLVGSMMLNLIVPRLAEGHSIKVILANRQRPETAAIPELGMMKMFEQDLPSRLLFPLLDARADRGSALGDGRWLSFDELGRHYQVDIRNVGHIPNKAALASMVQDAAPDLIVSFQFGFIFSAAALAIPRLGAVNLHSGELPHRAGVNPTFWCMKERAVQTACSLHWIDEGIDTGPLVEVRPMKLDYSRSFFANWVADYRNGAQLIGDVILELAKGGVVASVPQDVAQVRYVPTPTASDFRAFFDSGCRLIDPGDFFDVVDRYLPPN